MTVTLFLPWDKGFYEFYHSIPPIDYLKKIDDQGVVYVAPSPVHGGLEYVSSPEEYYDRQTEIEEWIENSQIDPSVDPFEGWYPFMEFDHHHQPDSEDIELFL